LPLSLPFAATAATGLKPANPHLGGIETPKLVLFFNADWRRHVALLPHIGSGRPGTPVDDVRLWRTMPLLINAVPADDVC